MKKNPKKEVPKVRKTTKKTVKGYVVSWFNEIQRVNRKVPSIYSTEKEAKEAYGDEFIETIPCTITYELPVKKK